MQLNTIYHGDCLDILRAFPDKSVDCIITDPPYIIGAKGCGLAGDRQYLHSITDLNIDYGFNWDVISECERVLKTMNLMVFSGRLQLKLYIDWIYKNNYTWNLICWHKPNPTPLVNNNYLPDTEYIFHIWQDRKLTGTYKSKRKYYVQPSAKGEGDHPCQKPLEILQNLVINASDKDDLILDPFCGSGSTLEAAARLGRRWIGIDIEERWVEYSRKRMAQGGLF